jgi:hypothetical protein
MFDLSASLFILEKAVTHGHSPHPAFGHLLPASGAKGEDSPRPLAGKRALNPRQVKALVKIFGVSPDVFMN